TLKDPYKFDFLTLTEGYKEKELEDALVTNMTLLQRVMYLFSINYK
ncbi:hypothetical protein EZS27_026398, partial [termite gut metagenome]